MKTKLFTITMLIFGGLLLASFQSSPDKPMAGPMENQTTIDNVLFGQLLKPDTLMGDHITNYPDPFCQTTTIQYEILHPTFVNLMITCPDKKNQTLVFGFHQPGIYTVMYDACNKPCGYYTAALMTYYDTEVEVMKKNLSTILPRPVTD